MNLKIFGGYFGDFADQDDRGGYSGYDVDENGFLLGLAKQFDENWAAGLEWGLNLGYRAGLRSRGHDQMVYGGVNLRW